MIGVWRLMIYQWLLLVDWWLVAGVWCFISANSLKMAFLRVLFIAFLRVLFMAFLRVFWSWAQGPVPMGPRAHGPRAPGPKKWCYYFITKTRFSRKKKNIFWRNWPFLWSPRSETTTKMTAIGLSSYELFIKMVKNHAFLQCILSFFAKPHLFNFIEF